MNNMFIKIRLQINNLLKFNNSCSKKSATWNINSASPRIRHVLYFIKEQNIDVMCLQEVFLFKFVKVFI